MKLEVHKLDCFYGRAQILFGVSLKVAAGEAVALLGRNGAGKSTTLRAILGLAADSAAASSSTAATSPTSRPTRSSAMASATCRRTGASSPT